MEPNPSCFRCPAPRDLLHGQLQLPGRRPERDDDVARLNHLQQVLHRAVQVCDRLHAPMAMGDQALRHVREFDRFLAGGVDRRDHDVVGGVESPAGGTLFGA